MGFSRFGFSITWRLVLILAALGIAGYLFARPGYPVATLLVLVFAVAWAVELFRFVAKTNREVSRFLDAVRYADFGQRFEFSGLGAGFGELGETFTHILDRFRADRSQQVAELRQLKAMLEHVPVPLLSIHGNEHVELWNNAARRLFGSVAVTRLDDLQLFGVNVPKRMRELKASERTLLTLQMENHKQTFSIATSEITIADGSQRLVSLQNIQSALDVTQLQAWQDLVRVLTHEIMNSITPVSSLSQTAVDLVEDVREKIAGDDALVAELDDVKNAVTTVARRSDGLLNFVASYRQLTRLPPPAKSRFALSDLFADVERIVTADWTQGGTHLQIDVTPAGLELTADRQMIEQALINLLQNAHLAVRDQGDGVVALRAALNPRGTVTVEVADNGPGVSEDIVDRIFVPFYTTRSEGSGVGLALCRQIMIAHGGTISYAPNPGGGALFSLSF